MIKDKEKLLNDNEDKTDTFNKLTGKEKILIVIIFIGFIYNVIKKYSDFGKKFSIIEFFFSKKCKNVIYQ